MIVANLFSPFPLKDVTLRNRIGMSPMTMYRSVDGKMNDFHVMIRVRGPPAASA